MLDAMSPDEFDERYAEYVINGTGDMRSYVALIASEIHNTMARYYMMKTGKRTKLATIEDYTPKILRRKRKMESIDPNAPGAGNAIKKLFGF